MALELSFIVKDGANPKVKELNKNLKNLQPTINKADKQFMGMNATLAKTAGVFASLYIVQDVAKSFIRTADAMTNAESKLKLVTSSTSELVKVQQELFAVSQDSTSNLENTTELYARLARSTKQLGTSSEDLLTVTETINKSMIVSGASSEEASRAVFQLSQAFMGGTLRAEEFNSIIEQAPRLIQAMADNSGVSMGQFRKMMLDGQVSAELMLEALKGQADTIDTEYDQMAMTVDRSMTNANNAMSQVVGTLNNMFDATGKTSSAFQGFADVLEDVNKRLVDYNANIDSFRDINRIKDTQTLNREFKQLTERYKDLVNEGKPLWQSQVAYNAEIIKLESLITKTVRKMGQLSEGEAKALETTDKLKNSFSGLKNEVDETAKKIDRIISTLLNESAKRGDQLDKEYQRLKKEAEVASSLLSLQQRASSIAKGSAIGKSLTDSASGIEFFRTFESELENSIHSAFSNMQDFDDFGQALGTAVSGALANSVSQSIASSMGGISGAFVGGIAGAGVGIAVSSIASYFGGDKAETQIEKADKYFNRFMDGLDEASDALQAFGNFGTALGDTLGGLQDELQSSLDWLGRFEVRVDLDRTEGENVAYSLIGSEVKDGVTQNILELNQETIRLDRIIENINKEISDVLFNELSQNIDFSTQSTERLIEITESFNQIKGEEVEQRINDIAILVKQGEAISNYEDELAMLFQDKDYKALLDYGDALDELSDRQQDAQDLADEFKDTMATMADSIDDTINIIKGNTLSSDEFTSDQLRRLNETQMAFESMVKAGDSAQAQELLSEITALSTAVSGTAFGDTRLINENLISQLEANKALVDFEDKILQVHIVGSDLDTAVTTSTTTPSVSVVNASDPNDVLSRLEALLTSMASNQKKVYNILLDIQQNGVETK